MLPLNIVLVMFLRLALAKSFSSMLFKIYKHTCFLKTFFYVWFYRWVGLICWSELQMSHCYAMTLLRCGSERQWQEQILTEHRASNSTLIGMDRKVVWKKTIHMILRCAIWLGWWVRSVEGIRLKDQIQGRLRKRYLDKFLEWA